MVAEQEKVTAGVEEVLLVTGEEEEEGPVGERMEPEERICVFPLLHSIFLLGVFV